MDSDDCRKNVSGGAKLKFHDTSHFRRHNFKVNLSGEFPSRHFGSSQKIVKIILNQKFPTTGS